MRFKIFCFLLLIQSLFCKGQSTDGDALFDSDSIHVVKIFFTQPGFWDSLTAYYALDKPMLGSVEIDGTPMDSVGVQLKGNSSYKSISGVKKPLKISFDEFKSQKFDGLKTVNLNNVFKDPSFLREKLMNDFLNSHGIPAPRCTYADVYINNTHWGFYTLVEQVNKTFLSDRFGNNDGNLYKGDPHGDLKWLGSTVSLYYPNYELKTNTTVNDWTDLYHLIDKINNSTTAQFHDSLESVMLTDYTIKSWAANNLFVNLDSYLGSGHNYYIYDDFISNKFEWIAWDVNEAFGNFNMGMSISQLTTMSVSWISSPATSRPLVNKMLQDTSYKNSYLNYLCQWIQNDFTLSAMSPKIDSLANRIRPYVYADPNKQFSNANFETNITSDYMNMPGIKDFITNRRANVNSQLSTLGVTCSLNTVQELTNGSGIRIIPNPFNQSAMIEVPDFQNGEVELSVFDCLGRTLFSMKGISPGKNISLERGNLSAGIYFVQLRKDSHVVASEKFIIE